MICVHHPEGIAGEPLWVGGVQPSLAITPELRYDSDDGRHQASLVPYLRLDAQDDERTHADLREAYWRYIGDDWEALVGVNTVFCGDG